jgi:homoserine dehydrogenase
MGSPRQRISIFGLGNVGQALLRSFSRVRGRPALVLAADGSGVFLGDDLDPRAVLERKRRRDYDRPREPGDADGLLRQVRPDVHVELTPTNLEDGQPAVGDIEAALRLRVPVVTAAKSHQRSRETLGAVLELAGETPFLDHAATLAGIPATEMVAGVGFELTRIEGVLNGTTNYILKRLSEGAAMDTARDEAIEKGFAERNWRYDLEGQDVAVKLVGLVRHLCGQIVGAGDVTLDGDPALGITKGIVGATSELMARLAGENKTLKLMGRVDVSDGAITARVGPVVLETSSPFASIEGFHNAVKIEGLMNETPMELFLRGPGAGADETASRVLGNLNHLIEVLAWRGTSSEDS